MPRAALACCLMLVVLIAGCAKSETPTAGGSTVKPVAATERNAPMGGPETGETTTEGRLRVVNAVCPIEPTHAIRNKAVFPEFSREYKGQTVGFCCDDCPSMWDAMSDQDKAAALAKAMDEAQ